jgi:hypothetical protein
MSSPNLPAATPTAARAAAARAKTFVRFPCTRLLCVFTQEMQPEVIAGAGTVGALDDLDRTS